MNKITSYKWEQSTGLLYRLRSGVNDDEITVTMFDGSRSESDKAEGARQLLSVIESHEEMLEALKLAQIRLLELQTQFGIQAHSSDTIKQVWKAIQKAQQ